MKTLLFLLSIGIVLASGCASTRGDAALKAGDLDLAAQIFREEAERGNADSALKLGDLHANYVVAAENDKPVYWYVQACDLGNAAGCQKAGEAYEMARGVLKDLNKAFEFYEKAARKGNVDAQYSVAGMYATGRAPSRDLTEGYKWGLVARERAEARFDDNREIVLADHEGYLRALEERLTPAERQRAEAAADAWRPEE